jgi:AraC family transcriptional activator of pobA
MPSRAPAPAIPIFKLYGEDRGPAPSKAETEFVHIETIGVRAGVHDWEIRPHRHADLYQCLLILKGDGRFSADGAEQAFSGPALLAVPPKLVHAFAFAPETQGYVLTLSAAFMDQVLRNGAAAPQAPAWPLAAPIAAQRDLAQLTGAFDGLNSEFHWPRDGRRAAIAAYLGLILVAAARLAAERPPPAPPGPDAGLIGALSVLIHRHAADNWGVEDYASALGVTPGRLTAVCRRRLGRSPMQLAHDHLMIEAKRNLIYTAMTVQEVGFSLGFTDPAYFSRFFSRREGVSPQRFRAARGRAETGSSAIDQE